MKNLTYENLKGMVHKKNMKTDSMLIKDNLNGYNSMKRIINHIIIDH